MNDPAGVQQPIRRDILPLACGIFLLYLLSSSWRFPLGSDGSAMLATSRSLLIHHALAVDPRFASDEAFGPSAKIGVDGRAYAKYGLGLPIIELPFVAAALVISRLAAVPEAQAVAGALSLLNPWLSTCTAIAVFSLCRLLGSSAAIARLMAIAYSLGTFAWVYAGVDGSEPLQALCVLLALLLLVRYRAARRAAFLWASGLALAYAIVTKPANAVLAPAFGLYAIAVCHAEDRPVRQLMPLLLRFAAPIGLCLIALAWLNWYRWGSVFETGYEPHAFTNQLTSGMYGLMLSFNKGIIFYAPLVLLAPLGIVFLGRTHRAEAALIVFAGLTYVSLFAKFYNWGGGWSWGPRYLMPILPLLMPPIARVATAARLWQYVVAILFAAGAAVNGVGVLVDGDAYHATIMDVDLTTETGFVRVGSVRRPGQMVEMAIPPDYVLPEFSEIVGKIWLARVAGDDCWCNQETAQCGCRSGSLEKNARFASPPWINRYPDVQPIPPYGARLINPWIAYRIHQRLLR